MRAIRFAPAALAIAACASVSPRESFLDVSHVVEERSLPPLHWDQGTPAKARVGNAVLELAAQVKQSFVSLQAAQATLHMRQLVLEAQQAAAELRRRQYTAGNVGDLELSQEEAFYQQEKLNVARAEAAVL